MKRLISSLLFIFILSGIFAQSPNLFNYQGVARDNTGTPLTNKSVGLRISLLKGSATGTEVYKELFLVTTNNLGLFSIQIGSGTVALGTIASIDWSKGPYFLKIELDPNATNTFQEIGTSQLLSVPYALYAKSSENSFSGNYNDLTNKPVGNAKGDLQYWSGSKWEVLPAGSNGQVLKVVNGLPAWVIGLPLIKTTVVTNITGSEATTGGNSISDGGEELAGKGICWSNSPYPTVNDNKVAAGTGTETFTVTLTGLTSSATYYVRAYATNSQGTAYGNQVSFNTVLVLSLATVTTASPTAVTSGSASLGGTVTSDGNVTVTDRGIVFATTQSPTIASSKVQIGTGAGSFSTTVTGLAPNTVYYARAYAINSQGTAYGPQVTFTTLLNLSPATVSTASVTTITTVSASLGGNVISDGNVAVSDRGIVYSTTPSPTLASIKVAMGAGTGVFSAIVSGLATNTTYYARAYAINSMGTAYGNEITFTTLANNPVLASVTTNSPTNVTYDNVILGGNVTADGYATVTERGIVYGTSQSPTFSANKVAMGSGTGAFGAMITGLATNTTYYARAYATNSQGTAFGNEVSFTTLVIISLPVVNTASPTTVTAGSAQLGGTVVSDGFNTVTERGIVYSTTQTPTTSGNKVVVGSGTDSFSTLVTGLVSNTTYYVRAYATNSLGTSYGAEMNFTTLQTLLAPSVSTASPTNITTTTA